MKEIYLISYVLKTSKNWSLFHFKGVCHGKMIKEICVHHPNEVLFLKEEYLLYLEIKELRGTRLVTDLLEAKSLKSLKFNF